MSATSTARSTELLDLVMAATGPAPQPILLSGGVVVSMNSMMGDWEQADVLLGGPVIVGVGPGLHTAAADDGMLVIDCTGCLVLPARTDFTAPATAGDLRSGSVADIAVIRLADRPDAPAGAVINREQHLDILLSNGQVTVWDGRRIDAPDTVDAESSVPGEHPYAGMWIDSTGFLHQELLPEGRYDETRGGRPHAYQGRYWITGTHIEYLDDLGFWAFGEFRDGVLHHADYRLTRA